MSKTKSKNKQAENYMLQRKIKREQKRKKNQRKKILKILKEVIIFSLIQFAIIYVGIIAFSSNVPISIENTETISFKADKVESKATPGLGRLSGTERYIFYYHKSDKYSYPDLFSYQYDGDNLMDDLRNEYLTATVSKGNNQVVELKGNNMVFYTIKDYNKTCVIRIILGVFVMLIIESTFLFVLLFRVLVYYIPPIGDISFKKLKFKSKKKKVKAKGGSLF